MVFLSVSLRSLAALMTRAVFPMPGGPCNSMHLQACVWSRHMSRNLARQISRDLHSDCFAMVLTAGFTVIPGLIMFEKFEGSDT